MSAIAAEQGAAPERVVPRRRTAAPKSNSVKPGAVYGRLTADSYVRGSRWACSCACGGKKVVLTSNLTSGNTTSCGCRGDEYRREWAAGLVTHGMTETREYGVWQGMLRRCNDPNNSHYRHYGGRGISVCERWQGPEGFANFYADMGPRPDGLTLERRNNDGPYSPDNCAWATVAAQSRNKRNTILATKDGRTQPLSCWARELGWSFAILRKRIANGESPDEAIARPAKPRWTRRRKAARG